MFRKILVALDGSKRAEEAIPVAARIARASGGNIVFVCVVLPQVEFGTYTVSHSVPLKPGAFEERIEKGTEYLTSITSTYADELIGIETEMDILSGAAAPAILSISRLEQVDLIVICSHGESGMKRWVFGSVAQEAVRHSPVPVLVLNEHGVFLTPPDATHPLHVLVTLDGSPFSETVLEPLTQLVGAWTIPGVQWELHLLSVVDLPSAYGKLKSQAYISDSMQEEAKKEAQAYIEAEANRLRSGILGGSEVKITSSVVVNADVANAIIKEAEHTDSDKKISYDLIAMATHGRSGLQRLVMGSVAENVMGTTKLPMLIVRPHKVEEKVEKKEDVQVEVEIKSWVGLL